MTESSTEHNTAPTNKIHGDTLDNLKQAWEGLRSDNPNLRIRNAANNLNVSELELALTELGNTVTRLDDRHGELIQGLEQVGPVMALSRNDQVVHEKTGIYTDFKIMGKGQMGLCLGDIDLRVFFSQWKFALSVNEPTEQGMRQSLQFFDASGNAVHKIYKKAQTHAEQWDQLIAAHVASEQTVEVSLSPIPLPNYPNAGTVSTEAVQAEWKELKDVHHFNAMLKRLGISRKEALRMVGSQYAAQVDSNKAEQALRLAQERHVPIMVFVGNRGIVQIHTGEITKLLRTGPWFNVLDPSFNLHFNTEQTAEVWLVKRPSTDGIITSIEVYNEKDDLILTLFGERKPGVSERADWQALVADLAS